MPRTLIRAHTILTHSAQHGTILAGGLIIEDGAICRVGALPELEKEGPFDVVLGDANRHLALPGLVNAHHHSYRPSRVNRDFPPIDSYNVRRKLRQLPRLTEEEVYDHTLWGTLQMVKAGVTAVIDHHSGVPGLEDSGVPASIQAYLDAGIRTTLCLSCADQNSFTYEDDESFLSNLPADLVAELRPRMRPFNSDAYFSLWERLHHRFDGSQGRIRIGLGPGGVQWCSEELLRRIRRAADARDAPVQIHLLETRYQAMYGLVRLGRTLVRFLADIGFWGPKTSCAHCVWVTRDDIGMLADSGVTVVHNPSSNLSLASGIAPVADMLHAGVRLAFGLDGRDMDDSADYLTDLRLAHRLQRRPAWDAPHVTAADMLLIATQGGAAALGLDGAVGRLEAGQRADVVLVDRTRPFGSPYVSPFDLPEEVLVGRSAGLDVDTVVVDGRVTVKEGKVTTVDEAALQQRLTRSIEPTYELARTSDALFERLEPYLANFFRRWEQESLPLLPPHYQYNTR